MSAGWTPGPWVLETVKTSCGICHKVGPFPWRENKPNYACIYVDYPNGAMGPVEAELKANANLIAAAPELYEALEGLVRYAEAVRMAAGMGKTQLARLEAGKAALAKARAAQAEKQ